jgi:hypothetical protein
MSNKPLYVAGLDAGGRHTRCVIGLVEDARLRYLGGRRRRRRPGIRQQRRL